MNLSRTRSKGEYQLLSLTQKPVVIFDDHRWILPVILEAQQDGLIPRPCTLVTFDQHHDAKRPLPKAQQVISEIQDMGATYEEVVKLVERYLSTNNDDWLKAGMELGFIGQVVNIGARDPRGAEGEFQDLHGTTKIIHFLNLPGGELDYQGDLSDLARRDELQPVWEVLGWEQRSPHDIFQFSKDKAPIVLDFDLDCFAIYWKEYIFPWLDEVWEKEFHISSDYASTEGLTGADVVDGLVSKAGLISIARSPNCCGGLGKAKRILEDINRFLFKGDLLL